MRLRLATCIGLGLILAPGLTRAADGWAKLHLGMTAAQTAAALGDPLLRTAGQGFEVWIYDHCAEAVFYGPLIGWTAPTTGGGPGKTADVWQAGVGRAAATAVSLPRPTGRRTSPRAGSQADDENKLPSYRLH
jgi:hypothetical protein